jgi:peptidyl-tRNA hydrolase
MRPDRRRKVKVKRQKAERRIYVVVASSVTVDGERIRMEPGRMAAQACHVTGRYRAKAGMPYKEITTIVLEARNSKELMKVMVELSQVVPEIFTFHDTNPDFYGTPGHVFTALCTEPVNPSVVDDAIGHLELM